MLITRVRAFPPYNPNKREGRKDCVCLFTCKNMTFSLCLPWLSQQHWRCSAPGNWLRSSCSMLLGCVLDFQAIPRRALRQEMCSVRFLSI
jgi:hypothetical protein